MIADEVLHVRGGLEDRVGADDQVDAGGHHRGRVDEGGDRRRAFHRVGQPGVERQLGRLGDGATEQPERDEVERARRELSGRGGVERQREVERPGLEDEQEERERHRRVADRVHDERLLRGRHRLRPVVVEADQEVRGEADEAPADEQQQQVAAHHEHQHREDEEGHVGEVAALLVLALHVADRVPDDQPADAGDDQHHRQRDRVDEDLHRHLELAEPELDAEPGVGRREVRAVVGRSRPATLTNATRAPAKPTKTERVAIQPASVREISVPPSVISTAPASGARRQSQEAAAIIRGAPSACRRRAASCGG